MERIREIIKEKPSFKLLGKARLYKVLKPIDKKITMKMVAEYLEDKPLQQVFHRPVEPVPLKITAKPRSFQIDIIEMTKYKKQNKGLSKFLLIADVMSRKAFAYPMKSGKMDEVLDKYKQFCADVGNINSVTGDDFFKNNAFLKFNQSKDIETFTDVAKDDHVSYGNKLGIVDRLTRTLKGLIKRKMVDDDNVKWTEYLDEIVNLYNSTPHSSLNDDTPNGRWKNKRDQEEEHSKDILDNEKQYKKVKVDVGDDVRIFKGKETFKKEDMTFSRDIYKIVGKSGLRFKVVDEEGKPYKRNLKAHELLKIAKKVSKALKTDNVKKAEKHAKVERKLKQAGVNENNIKRKTREEKGVKMHQYLANR